MELAHPLYQAINETQKTGTHLVDWEPEQQKAFDPQALLKVPALGLLIGQVFNLYVHERNGMALRVITQP